MEKQYDTEIPNNEHYSLEEYEELVKVYENHLTYLRDQSYNLHCQMEPLYREKHLLENNLKSFQNKVEEIQSFPKWKKWLLGIKF